jgi:hypothetical protein
VCLPLPLERRCAAIRSLLANTSTVSIRSRYPWLRYIFADGGYAGDKLRKALNRIGGW